MTDSTAATPFLAGAIAADLEEWGPLEEATGEPMQTTGTTLWADGDQEVGVWECTPGPSHWALETNEAVYILSGRMTVLRRRPAAGHRPRRHRRLPRGWQGNWQIHETIRKLYVLF
jgi:uncharacterized cupin superfamily protein